MQNYYILNDSYKHMVGPPNTSYSGVFAVFLLSYLSREIYSPKCTVNNEADVSDRFCWWLI